MMPFRLNNSRIKHPALAQTLFAFRAQEQQEKDPVVAILGPAGCGKSDLLKDLLAELAEPTTAKPGWKRIVVDLLNVPTSTETEMYGHVVAQMRESALGEGLSIHLKSASSGEQMDYILEEAASQCGGRLIFAVDHLNCVPYQFGQQLSQRLRGLKENGDRAAELAKMALLVSGTASLYRLASSDKSAFHLARVVCLPLVDPEPCEQFIRDTLEKNGHEGGSQVTCAANHQDTLRFFRSALGLHTVDFKE